MHLPNAVQKPGWFPAVGETFACLNCPLSERPLCTSIVWLLRDKHLVHLIIDAFVPSMIVIAAASWLPLAFLIRPLILARRRVVLCPRPNAVPCHLRVRRCHSKPCEYAAMDNGRSPRFRLLCQPTWSGYNGGLGLVLNIPQPPVLASCSSTSLLPQ